MRKLVSLFCLCALALLIVGCSDDDGKGAASARSASKTGQVKSPFPVDNLAPTTVVMLVNGCAVTQADYAGWYRLRERIYRVTNKLAKNERSDRTRAFAMENRSRVVGDLLRRELMRQEAERLGVVVPEESIRRMEKRFMSAIGHAGEPFSRTEKMFGGDAELLKKVIYMDVRDGLCLERASTNDLKKIPPKEIDDYIASAKKANAEAERKMAEQRERALRVREEILNGGNFAAVTSNRADIAKGDGTIWLTCSFAEAMEENEALAKWLVTAKVGDISEPMDFDDGIAIVGLRYVFTEEDPEEGKEPEKEYDLVRCTFTAYDQIEDLDDRKGIESEMLDERRVQALGELGARLTSAAKIEYPLGTKIFDRQRPKKAAKPRKKKPNAGNVRSSGKPNSAATNGVAKANSASGPVDSAK